MGFQQPNYHFLKRLKRLLFCTLQVWVQLRWQLQRSLVRDWRWGQFSHLSWQRFCHACTDSFFHLTKNHSKKSLSLKSHPPSISCKQKILYIQAFYTNPRCWNCSQLFFCLLFFFFVLLCFWFSFVMQLPAVSALLKRHSLLLKAIFVLDITRKWECVRNVQIQILKQHPCFRKMCVVFCASACTTSTEVKGVSLSVDKGQAFLWFPNNGQLRTLDGAKTAVCFLRCAAKPLNYLLPTE